jgi:hypothetical protein
MLSSNICAALSSASRGGFYGSTRFMSRGIASGQPSGKHGALVYDYTFTRVMGTPNQSEEILKDLLSSWRCALLGSQRAVVEDLTIMDKTVRDGFFPKSKGELCVDVHFTDAKHNYIVEVQHRIEPLFPHRALQYACADIVAQRDDALLPVHTLAFCDFDFSKSDAKDGAISTKLTNWRASPKCQRDPSKAFSMYGLLPFKDRMQHLGQTGNTALSEELEARMTFVFAMLPHAPRLEDLAASTPPLLRWASLVAHVEPNNIDVVPKDVRSIEGVKKLLDILRDTKDKTEQERLDAEKEARQIDRAVESALEEGKAEGRAEG